MVLDAFSSAEVVFCPMSFISKCIGPSLSCDSDTTISDSESPLNTSHKKRYRSLNLCHFVVTEGSPRICQVPSFCRGKLELCSVIAVHPGVVATKMVHNSTRET